MSGNLQKKPSHAYVVVSTILYGYQTIDIESLPKIYSPGPKRFSQYDESGWVNICMVGDSLSLPHICVGDTQIRGMDKLGEPESSSGRWDLSPNSHEFGFVGEYHELM